MTERSSHSITQLLASGLAYFLLARFGGAVFALQPSNLTLLWLPVAVALMMYLRWGWRAFPVVAIASLAANQPGMAQAGDGWPWLHTAIAALIDAGAGALAMRQYRRYLPHGLQRSAELIPFCLHVCVLPIALSSALLALNLWAGAYVTPQAALMLAPELLLADCAGLLLLFPVLTLPRRALLAPADSPRRLLGAGALVLLILALGLGIVPGVIFLLPPLLLLLAQYLAPRNAAVLGMLALLAVYAGTAQRLGPFGAAASYDSQFRVAIFALGTMLTLLAQLLQQLQLRHSERQAQHWQDEAGRDMLTGLTNRRSFVPRLEQEHQLAALGGRSYALALLDVDHFKQVNDRYGHASGDLVLQQLAAVLREQLRHVDVVCRYGGEEFAVLLPDCDLAAAVLAMERVRQAQAQRQAPFAPGLRVTVSIGLAAHQGAGDSTEQVLARADAALYRAKAEGRDRLSCAPPL